MRATIQFIPKHWTRRGDYIVLRATVPAPDELPRELPRIPAKHRDTWTVLIGLRQWHKVSKAVHEHPGTEITVEGAPVCLDGQLTLLGRTVRSMVLEKQRQQEQREAALAAVAS
jgi:hypothetical protein